MWEKFGIVDESIIYDTAAEKKDFGEKREKDYGQKKNWNVQKQQQH